jgi:FkbM family methyltransferase
MKTFLKYIYSAIPFKKYIFQLIRPLRIPKGIYQHLYFKGVLQVKLNDQKFLIEHYGFDLENDLFWAGLTEGREKVSMQQWIKLCENAEVILDVGANTGIYSLVAKAIKSKAKVYGFEPVNRVFKKFQQNCELNHYDIHCCNYALSNQDGQAIIFDQPTEHIYSVSVNKNMAEETTEVIKTNILTKKLATFIKENGLKNIDLIKIDVETHEPEVLEGMEEYLQLFQPTMLIEILNDEIGQRVEALIKNIDYLYFNIDEIHPPILVENIHKSDCFNYLICKKEIAQKLNLI